MVVSQTFFSKQRVLSVCLGVSACAMSMASLAGPITPQFDRFGALSEATWGGTGIPNDSVAITEINILDPIQTGPRTRSLGKITLGLSSHGRYENEDEGNDGAGTFSASTGKNTPPSSSLEGATWNFNFYIDFAANTSGSISSDYRDEKISALEFALLYDFDPAEGTDEANHGIINIPGTALVGNPGRVESSQNLLFGFLGNSSSEFGITAPAGSFDPLIAGEYSFALTASDPGGVELGRSAIIVNTVSQVPEPSTLALLGLGLVGLGWSRRKKA